MKKIRLDKEIYQQQGRPCHITICSKKAKDIFQNKEFTIFSMDLLETLCRDYEFELIVYCFMPKHVHFIVSVKGQKPILSLVQAFKSKVTLKSYQYGFTGRIFQTIFYDRFIRSYQSLENEINYVVENPVRRELVIDSSEYPYSKCFI